MTKQEGTDRILDAKKELNEQLKSFGKKYVSCNRNATCISTLIGEIVERHSDVLNTVSIVVYNLHEEYDFFYTKNLRQDIEGTLKNFIETSLNLTTALNAVAAKNGLKDVVIAGNSYLTIQRFINTFSDELSKNTILNQFTTRTISTEGFKQKFKKTMKRKYLGIQLWIGIPLLLLCGAVVFMGEHFLGRNFNGLQLIFLKALMSLSISAAGSSLIEGNANYQWTFKKGLTIRAVGWVGIFLLLYFLNPASPGEVH